MTLFHAIRRRYLINRAVRELSVLSNAQLKDIGIERVKITELVENMIDARLASSIDPKPAATGYAPASYSAAGRAAA